MRVIAEMIGVPPGDAADFRRWSDSIIEAGGGGVTDQTLQDMGELFAYFSASIEEHRGHPRGDIITLLLDAELDGEGLSQGEILMFLMTLLVAGNETTRNLIAGGARALAEHPDQQARLASDPSLVPGAVDEMLRWVSPVRSFVRRAQIDTTIGDTAVRAGDYVTLFYGSGNRDEAVFGPTADRFDVTRADAYRHIAFGFGEHLCMGAALAKVEARVMFEELLARWPRWELAGDVGAPRVVPDERTGPPAGASPGLTPGGRCRSRSLRVRHHRDSSAAGRQVAQLCEDPTHAGTGDPLRPRR